MMGVDSIINKSAEFGLVAFLLVLTWAALAIGLWWIMRAGWSIANRLADNANAVRLQQAAALDRIAESTVKISTMTAVMATQTEGIEAKLEIICRQNGKHARVARMIIDALKQVVPVEKANVAKLLDDARAQLEE
jgi:hypothetical protein